MEKLVISNEAWYDNDAELWYCYIGKDNKKKDLILTVWGKTEDGCRHNAETILPLITVNKLS